MFIFALTSVGQRLTISDLSKLTSMTLNNGESFLSKKKFEFIETSKDTGSSYIKSKSYIFSYNMDRYGDKGDEFLILSFLIFGENSKIGNNPSKVWYQLSKEGWLKLKTSLAALGYKKTKTQSESNGSLTTIYRNEKSIVYFNSGKSQELENNGAMVYIIYMIKRVKGWDD